MGLPVTEAPRFMDWEALILHGNTETDPDRSKAYQAMLDVQDYFRSLAARRRLEPADDLVSHLVQCRIDGAPLSEEDLLSTCLLMFMAGLDTVTSQLSYTFWHLATHPADHRRIVDDPAIIPSAVEEFLRYYAIVNTGSRATQDVEYHGCPIKRGDMVLFPFASANRDERSFNHTLRRSTWNARPTTTSRSAPGLIAASARTSHDGSSAWPSKSGTGASRTTASPTAPSSSSTAAASWGSRTFLSSGTDRVAVRPGQS